MASAPEQKLNRILRDAYAASVLGRGQIDVVHINFASLARDADFLACAKRELERVGAVASVRNRDDRTSAFIEQQHAKFLREAMKRVETAK